MAASTAAIPHFDDIYETYHGRVVRYLANIVGPDDADDIAQETFIKVHKNLARLEEPEKLAAWIFKIALNTARDWMRKRGKAPVPTVVDEAAGETSGKPTPTAGRSPEERMIRKEMVQCYLNFVEALPRSSYEVYVLSEFDGLSNHQIARRLDLPVETVKMRLHRARERLYKELRAHCSPYFDEHGDLKAEPK